MKVPDELVEALAEALHDEREYREPGGERYGDQADESAPREPFLWKQMVREGKYEGDQAEYRKDARAALEAVLPKVRELVTDEQGAKDAMEVAAYKEINHEGEGCGCPLCVALSSVRAAFDHAFPTDVS